MELFRELSDQLVWQDFLVYRQKKGHMTKDLEKELSEFVTEKKYQFLVNRILAGDYSFALPKKNLVNKVGSDKKRIVYQFPKDETMLLKCISYLLYRYDSCFSDNLYSFRSGYGAQRAIKEVRNIDSLSKMYGYKADITNYFNSIDIDILLPILQRVMIDDPGLFKFMECLLSEDRALCEGELLQEKRGVMAGSPISPFLANVYLTEMDEYFSEKDVFYARYSDDVLLFCKSKEDREKYVSVIADFLRNYRLTMNMQKEMQIEPGETWDFLGIAYHEGQIDLSDTTVQKMKGKIRRKARAVYRWKVKNNVSDEVAMKTLIKIFNNKFYLMVKPNDLTWSRWFFPLLTVDDSLHVIDEYLLQNVRFLSTGRYSKVNYRVTYEQIKGYGYRSLVHEFWEWKKVSPIQ